MNITDVNKKVKGHKRRRRVARGAASGWGKTAGRGMNGLGSRAGANRLRGYVGGQKRLMERIPKRGFNNAVFAKQYVPVNVAELEKRFDANAEVTVESLRASGLTVGRDNKVKVLGSGDLSKSLTVKVHACSKSAREKIEKAGGKVEIIS